MRRLFVLVLAVAAIVGATASDAGASAPTALGWWWKASPLPAPPTVPAGGFMVASDPSGPTAVAALRFALSSSQTAPFLTLEVAENGDVNGATASVLVSRAVSPWSPAVAGDWATQPTVDALAAVKGTRSEDGKLWTFDLSSIYDGGELDIVVKPDPAMTFAVTFNPPTANTLRTSQKPLPISEYSPDPVSDFETEASPFADTGVPLDAGYVPSTDEIALTVSPPSEQGSAALPSRGLPLATPAGVSREAAGLGLILLLAAAGATYALSRMAPPPVRALGPMTTSAFVVSAFRPGRSTGEASVGGLGRFARTRSGPPPKL